MKFQFLAICLVLTGCASTTLYRDGQKLAVLQGDMTNFDFYASADGSIRWKAATVDHSSATSAQKAGAANIVTQAGAAVAASGLTLLFK